jgi:hypothetical protein
MIRAIKALTVFFDGDSTQPVVTGSAFFSVGSSVRRAEDSCNWQSSLALITPAIK